MLIGSSTPSRWPAIVTSTSMTQIQNDIDLQEPHLLQQSLLSSDAWFIGICQRNSTKIYLTCSEHVNPSDALPCLPTRWLECSLHPRCSSCGSVKGVIVSEKTSGPKAGCQETDGCSCIL